MPEHRILERRLIEGRKNIRLRFRYRFLISCYLTIRPKLLSSHIHVREGLDDAIRKSQTSQAGIRPFATLIAHIFMKRMHGR